MIIKETVAFINENGFSGEYPLGQSLFIMIACFMGIVLLCGLHGVANMQILVAEEKEKIRKEVTAGDNVLQNRIALLETSHIRLSSMFRSLRSQFNSFLGRLSNNARNVEQRSINGELSKPGTSKDSPNHP